MAQVSRKFAERVSGYKGGGFSIPSAEGFGISSSKESREEGLRLSEARLRRLKSKRATQTSR